MKGFLEPLIIIIFLFSLFFVSLHISLAATDSLNVSLKVSSSCGNKICQPAYGEKESTCSVDCGCDNNGICEPLRGEDRVNCSLDCPEIEPEQPGGVGIFDNIPPVIFNLFISKITLNSAVISWETNEQALCQFYWGRTSEYKEGAISENVFYRQHSTELVNLLPNTTYHFKIICRDSNYNESQSKDQHFSTLVPPDIIPPANPSDFKAIAGDKQIKLSWRNPPDPDFKAVKIMRSDKFYPVDPWDGTVVYDGKGTSFIDKGLENGVRYYYTAFAYDESGNYASGAVVSAVPQIVVPPEEIPPVVPPPIFPPLPPEEIPPAGPPPPEVKKIEIKDFDFIQEGEKLSLIEEKMIKAKAEEPLTISIDYEKVPEVLKTIMVTLEKGDRFFSFLLRVNKGKTAYMATFFVPQETGIYPLTITILDYKNQTLKKIKAVFGVEKVKPSLVPEIPWHQDSAFWRKILYLLIGILLVLITRYTYRQFVRARSKPQPLK